MNENADKKKKMQKNGATRLHQFTVDIFNVIYNVRYIDDRFSFIDHKRSKWTIKEIERGGKR